MTFLIWNVTGLANPRSRHELANICLLHRPTLIAISEPMVDLKNIDESLWRFLHLPLVAVSTNYCPKLWAFNDDSIENIDVLSCGKQQITVSITTLEVFGCTLSFIYAFTLYINRTALWSDLLSVSAGILGPWLAVSEFNETLGAHEQYGGSLPGSLSTGDLQNFIDSCCLTQVLTDGLFFTHGMRVRALCNSSGMNN